jgi:pyruvate kinase
MIDHQLDVVRLNFSWGDTAMRVEQIALVKKLAKEAGRHIPIIIDLPGPRVQEEGSHTYNRGAVSALTEQDKGFIRFAVEQGVDYIAVSFVGGPEDVRECKALVAQFTGNQKVIAKIERAIALESLGAIIAEADAVMVARGDLGNEVPLEQIPFVQERIIRESKAAGKPVITATQMLISMVNSPVPTRAEVTDVTNAILEGSDAIMLSEESAIGNYPVEVIAMMERIAAEAELHMKSQATFNHL